MEIDWESIKFEEGSDSVLVAEEGVFHCFQEEGNFKQFRDPTRPALRKQLGLVDWRREEKTPETEEWTLDNSLDDYLSDGFDERYGESGFGTSCCAWNRYDCSTGRGSDCNGGSRKRLLDGEWVKFRVESQVESRFGSGSNEGSDEGSDDGYWKRNNPPFKFEDPGEGRTEGRSKGRTEGRNNGQRVRKMQKVRDVRKVRFAL